MVGIDFPYSLAETHLRQLGLLRQALRGPASLGRGLEERFFPQGADFSEAAEAFKGQLGKDSCCASPTATARPPFHPRTCALYRQTFFGLLTLARLSDVAFVPWEPPKPNRPVLAEVRPEHVARVMCGACAYRDDDARRREPLRRAGGGAAHHAHRRRARVRDGARREGGGGREGPRARRGALGGGRGGGAGGELPRRPVERAAQ